MPDVNNPVLKLEHFLPYRLSVVANRISKALADAYQQQFDMSRPQWRVLAVLGERSQLSANEVTDKTAMDKVAVSRAVRGLVDKGWVRQDVNLQDKRRSTLSLTREGMKTYNAVIPVAQGFEHQLLSQLDDHEQALLQRVLTKLDSFKI